MIEDFSLFGETAFRLQQELVHLYFLMLPVFFALALVIDWFKNPTGTPDFISTVKRAFIATLLVIGFQEISGIILEITSGIADKISDLSSIDSIIQMLSHKTKEYSMSPMSALLGFNDLVIAIISYLSFVILYVARYIMVAVYHFMWGLLTILSPMLILFTLFRGTLGIPINLFRSMIEVASYKIIWAVLAVMIQSLAFGHAYAVDGNYLTVIVLNVIIALAMLGTPLIVRALVGAGLSSMSNNLGTGAVIMMVSAPPKAATLAKHAASVGQETAGVARHQSARLQNYFNRTKTF